MIAQRFRDFPLGWRSLILLLLILGICFRFYPLERKIYWGDEVFTSIRISGYAPSEVVEQVYNGQVIGVRDLQKYQHPNSERGLQDTLNALAGNPEHSPGYYLMARFWMQHSDRPGENLNSTSQATLAESVQTIRSLSAFISLLTFPCLYWLCLELFQSSLTAWSAMGLVAVSPFHVLYAQEARAYSLWIVTILLCSAALLRAVRLGTRKSWGLYAIALTLALYAFLLSVLVAIAHGFYIGAMSNFRWSKTVSAYGLASLTGLLLFAPWLWVITIHFHQLRENVAHLNQAPLNSVAAWLTNLSRVLIDFNSAASLANPLIYIVLILTAYALYWLYRNTPKQSLFIFSLIGVVGLTLLLTDLGFGGRRSTVMRYLIPCYLGIQLAIAHLFASQIGTGRGSTRLQKRWQQGLVVLFLAGILSCAASAQAQTWWNKGGTFQSRQNVEMAEVVNQSDRPLIISDTSVEEVISLSYLLNSDAKFQLVAAPNLPQISDAFKTVFLYRPSGALHRKIERKQHYLFTAVYESLLWKATW